VELESAFSRIKIILNKQINETIKSASLAFLDQVKTKTTQGTTLATGAQLERFKSHHSFQKITKTSPK
jgi:hypothetical protein